MNKVAYFKKLAREQGLILRETQIRVNGHPGYRFYNRESGRLMSGLLMLDLVGIALNRIISEGDAESVLDDLSKIN